MDNKLKIRLFTLTAILLTIVAFLSLYEVSQIEKLPRLSKFSSPNKTAPPVLNTNKDASSSVEITGPGGCLGIDQCLQYCHDHPDVCSKKTP